MSRMSLLQRWIAIGLLGSATLLAGTAQAQTQALKVGDKAPAFELTDHLGRSVTLDQLIGERHVMLLFYPLDFTPT